MVGEYLMFFQRNTRSKFTIAKNWTLFFHQFKSSVLWRSGNIGASSVQALHSRVASCEYARLEYRIFVYLPFGYSRKRFSNNTFSVE